MEFVFVNYVTRPIVWVGLLHRAYSNSKKTNKKHIKLICGYPLFKLLSFFDL